MKNRSNGSWGSCRSRRRTLTLTTAGASRLAAVTIAVWRVLPRSWLARCGVNATVATEAPRSSEDLFIGKILHARRALGGPGNQATPVGACTYPSRNPPLGARPMYRRALRQATVYSALLYFALALPAAGQGRGKVKQKQPTDLSPVGGADSLNNLTFRNLG